MPVRRTAIRLTMLSILVAISAVVASAPAASSAPIHITAVTSPVTVTVMDWNIEGANNAFLGSQWTGIESVIRAENPDIVTLQEVHDAAGETITSGGVSHPGINEVARLVQDFPQYNNVGSIYHYIWARTDGDGNGGSAGNLILSRFPLRQRYQVLLPNVPGNGASCPTTVDHSGSAVCPVNRGFAGIDADVNGLDVRVYTTHLSVGVGTVGPSERGAQVPFIVTKLHSPTITSPFVFAGDLNMEPGDPLLSQISAIGMHDAWTDLYDNIGPSAITHPGSDTDARIDYMWASPGFNITAIHHGTVPAVSGTPVSDHLPVTGMLSVRIPAPAKATGASNTEGWAGAVIGADGTATLRTCDDTADLYGEMSFLYAGSTLLLSGRDDHFADMCITATTPIPVPVPVTATLQLQVCRNNAGVPDDCVVKQF